MKVKETTLAILDELKNVLSGLDDTQTEEMVDSILKANKIFVAGAGRSLLMMRGLAMRLMHMGIDSFVVGETVTPAIQPGDLLIIGSGSGETGTLTVMANKAKKVGAELGLITIFPDSTIGRLADHVLVIPASTTKGDRSGAKSIQPGANSFEQSTLLVGDALVMRVVEKAGIDNVNADLMRRHANLE